MRPPRRRSHRSFCEKPTPAMFVDGDVHAFPSAPSSCREDCRKPMAGAHDAAELLDGQVQQVAGRGMLVVLHGRPRVDRRQRLMPMARQSAAQSRHRSFQLRSDGTEGWLPHAVSRRAAGRAARSRRGRLERSSKPASPSPRSRASHLRGLGSEIFASAAAIWRPRVGCSYQGSSTLDDQSGILMDAIRLTGAGPEASMTSASFTTAG